MSYPILYKSTETQFDTNGIGVLSDAVSCVVSEERNGPFELSMQYPITGIHYDDIVDRSLILAKPSPNADAQPFRVYRSTKPINGIVTFYAQHISYDLNGIVVSPFSATNISDALRNLKEYSVEDCPFSFFSDKATVAKMSVSVPSNIRSLLGGQAGSVLDVYGGGEYKFDRYEVWLYQHRGTERGVAIKYGKNLLDVEQERNISSVYTGVYPYWTNTDGEIVQLPEKIVKASGNFDYSRYMPLDFSQEWQEKPSVDQLRSRAESYIKSNNIGLPAISLTVSYAMLENTEEYKGMALLERIDLCDTVSIEFPKLGISESAKAVKAEFNVLLNRYNSITFGETKPNLANTVAAQTEEIKKTEKNTLSTVQQAISDMNNTMQNASGMYTTEEKAPDGSTITYLHDKKTFEESKNVLKITADAIGVSTDGGETYPFGLYINGDLVSRILSAIGIEAEWINAGTVNLQNLIIKGSLGGFMEGAGSSEGQETKGILVFGPNGLDSNGIAVPPYMILTNAGWRVQMSADSAFFCTPERVRMSKSSLVIPEGSIFVDSAGRIGNINYGLFALVDEENAIQLIRRDHQAKRTDVGNDTEDTVVHGKSIQVGSAGKTTNMRGDINFTGASVSGLSGAITISELLGGTLSSGSKSISGSGYNLYVVVGAPGSTSSRASVVIPASQLGNRFQIADDSSYTSFTLSASSIAYNGSNKSGVIYAVYGVK